METKRDSKHHLQRKKKSSTFLSLLSFHDWGTEWHRGSIAAFNPSIPGLNLSNSLKLFERIFWAWCSDCCCFVSVRQKHWTKNISVVGRSAVVIVEVLSSNPAKGRNLNNQACTNWGIYNLARPNPALPAQSLNPTKTFSYITRLGHLIGLGLKKLCLIHIVLNSFSK